MSNPVSDHVLHPRNPTMQKDMNTPKERGQTRVLPDGSLLYLEPITRKEVPAIRLDSIRPRLVEEASKKKSYRFPKKRGYEDTNVTAFVKKDYNYGSKRANRPDRLFQIHGSGCKGEKPEGYIMDEGRIVLDGFDHGLRNFGNQLPIYVSSELEGHDIEDYLRRNREISVYDLVARAPNGYFKGPPETKTKGSKAEEKAREWHAGPPRVGTFSMRATRFRLTAGCLSWETKDGTAAKNQRILDLIPAEFKDPAVNSTKGWRDFNKKEMKIVKDGAMRKPQQGPKEKRAAQAAKERERMENAIQDSAEREEILKNVPEVQHEDNDAWVGPSNSQASGQWPEYDTKDCEESKSTRQSYHKNPRSSKPLQPSSVLDEYPLKTTRAPPQQDSMQSLKRSRGALNEDVVEENNSNRASKRTRVATDSHGRGNQRSFSRMGTSRMGRLQQGPVPTPAPAPSPYAAVDTSPAFAYPALKSNSLRSTPRPLSSKATFPSSSPVYAEPRHQPSSYSNSCNPTNATNMGSIMLNMYLSNLYSGEPDDYYSSLQTPLDRNERYYTSMPDVQLGGNPLYGYTQPDEFQTNQGSSWSLGNEPNETPGLNPLYEYAEPDSLQMDQVNSWPLGNEPNEIPRSSPLSRYAEPDAFQIDQANSWSLGHESSGTPGSRPSYRYAQPDAFHIDQANSWSLGQEPCELPGLNPSYGYTPPDALQFSQTCSQTFEPFFPNNVINSGLDVRANNGDYYLAESDFSYQETPPTPQQPPILLSTNASIVKHPVGMGLSTGINPALPTLSSSKSMY